MGGAITSEIRKVFTTRMWWGMAIGMAILAALMSMLLASLIGLEGSGFTGFDADAAEAVYNAGLFPLLGTSLTSLFPLTLGILLVTNEYRHQTITGTYLATPKRWVVTAAKLVAVTVVGVVYGVVHVVASVIGGAGVLTLFKDVSSLHLTDGGVLGSFGIAILATIIWTALGYGFGMLVRNQIAAILIGIGVAFLGQLVLNIVFAIKEWWLPMKLLPGNLTANMLAASAGDPELDPSGGASTFDQWWVAGLVLFLYAVVLAVIGSILASRRDVA